MCQNRKMSMQKGIVCGLTGEKPQFEENCESYVLDENELEQQKERQELEQQEELSELNNPDENDGTLPGAGWFKTIAILSLLNIFLYFIDISFVFGLSSTQLLQVAIQTDLINPVVGVFGMLFIPAFFYLTWWMTAKKGYRLCYNIGYALYVLDAVLFVVLMYKSGEMAFIPDLIFHAIVLFVGFKIFKVNSSKYASDNTPNSTAKLMYALVASLAAVVSVVSLTTFTSTMEISEDNIDEHLALANQELPAQIAYGLQMTEIYLDNHDIVFVCQFEEITSDEIDSYALRAFDRELRNNLPQTVRDMQNDPIDSKFIEFMVNYQYNMVYRFVDCNGTMVSSVSITYQEIEQAMSR